MPCITGERAVATDDYEGVNLVFAHVFPCFSTSLFGLKLGAAGGLEDGASLLHNVTYVLGLEILDFVGDEALIAAVDTLDLEPVEDGRTGDGTDSGIHARCVAARGEDAYAIDSSCHGE